MNEKQSSQLLDEADLRAALLPLRPDPVRFAEGIRRRLQRADGADHSRLGEAGDGAASERRATERATERRATERSEWLQTAAAVIPLSLVGKGGSGGLIKLGQLTLGKKIVALAALPAVGLLLMITASIWAIIKIRRAHRGQPAGDIDVLKTNQVLAVWWRRFGLVTMGFCAVLLLLMRTGYTLPVFIVFLISGIAMVSLVTKLGQERLIERNAIAGALSSGLFLLAQLTQIAVMSGHGTPFLDQMLIPAVLMCGAFLISCLCRYPMAQTSGMRGAQVIMGILFLLLVGSFSSTVWNPVTQRELKTFVESFDHARFSSASWHKWQVPAQWLRDANVPLDLSQPRALIQKEIAAEKPNRTILCTAAETGLLQPADVDQVRGLDKEIQLMFDPYNVGRPFISVETQTSFLIHALVMRGDLSDSERDILGERLAVTMTDVVTKPYQNALREQLTITKLSRLIGRPLNIDVHRPTVHETLIKQQCLGHGFGQRTGGFTSYKNSGGNSHPESTDDAIQLMQIYGVPAEVRIDALRSFLRPSWHEQSVGLREEGYVRFASLQRLQSLPEVPPLTWWDYFRFEQNLMMAILFTCICVFATLGAPQPTPGVSSASK